jgi:hypothetical protein
MRTIASWLTITLFGLVLGDCAADKMSCRHLLRNILDDPALPQANCWQPMDLYRW